MPSEPSPWFWGVLESSGRNLVALCRQLETMSQEQVAQYRREYDSAKWAVNPLDWDDAFAHLAPQEGSEDNADDFAAWVVGLGREFFQEVRAHPAEIQRYLDLFHQAELGRGDPRFRWDDGVDRADYGGYQRPDFIASAIERIRFRAGEDE